MGDDNGGNPRIVYPTYEYDPNGVYEDPNVQDWAHYYASGGTDMAGAVYFTSIPGLKELQFANPWAAPMDPQPAIRSGSEPSSSRLHVQPVASTSQSPRPPLGPRAIQRLRSNERARKGVVGLLEFLHITSRKFKASASQPFSPSSQAAETVATRLEERSVYTDDEVPTDTEAQLMTSDGDLDPGVRESVGEQSVSEVSSGSSTPDKLAPEWIPPPTYAESVYEPSLAPYASGKTSFSPSVYFGESNSTDAEQVRRLPEPRVSPYPQVSLYHDEKARSYDVGFEDDVAVNAEDTALEEVPQRVSLIEERLSSGEEQLAFKPIYHNLMTLLLQEVTPVNNSTTDAVLDTLNDYAVSLRSFDAVTSLVKSHIYRGSLLQVASVLSLSDDPRVRRALQEDETNIATILHRVSVSDADRQAVISLEGDDAQSFLNVVQDVLDRGFLLDDPDESLKARRLLVKLSSNCYKLPAKLFIEGVVRSEEHAFFGGGFGDVFRGTYRGRAVALKRMRIFQRESNLPQIRRKFCQEALTWQSMKHTYIVPFLGITSEEFPDVLCMVSPWMNHGTVLKYLADNGRATVNSRLHEISQGLSYLHSQRIIHGDLRGANILINDDWQACLTDFGLTVFHDNSPATYTSRRDGSVRWMAPELFFPQMFGMERFRLTPASDVYAFACTCVELYTGKAPFSDIFHDPGILLKVGEGVRPERPLDTDPPMSDDLWRLIESCWSQKWVDRPSIKAVVNTMAEIARPADRLPNVGRSGDIGELKALLPLPLATDIIETVSNSAEVPSIEAVIGAPLVKEESKANRHVHFDVSPSTSTSTSLLSILKTTSGGLLDPRYMSAREATTRTASSSYDGSWDDDPVVRWLSRPYDTDDSSTNATLSVSEMGDGDVDSSTSSAFDPDLLVSPRKPKESFLKDVIPLALHVKNRTEEARLRYGYEDTIPSIGTSKSEADIWDIGSETNTSEAEEVVPTWLLSTMSKYVLDEVPREVCLWRGELYSDSFTNDDLVSTIEKLLRALHDPTDTELPFSALASDVTWSLFCQGAFRSVEPVTQRSQSNVYFAPAVREKMDDHGCNGVIPMLTPCYSPDCTQGRPCYAYSCPRWGAPEPRPRDVVTTPEVGEKPRFQVARPRKDLNTKSSITPFCDPSSALGSQQDHGFQGATTTSKVKPHARPQLNSNIRRSKASHPSSIIALAPPQSILESLEAEHDHGFAHILKPKYQARIVPLESAKDEGDLLDRYWDLIDEMDGVFTREFKIDDFSEEVKVKVEAIRHPRAPEGHSVSPLMIILVLLSFPMLYAITLSFVPGAFDSVPSLS